MRIPCPPAELVGDGSKWDDHLRPNELLAGGVMSFIIGLYQGKWDGSKFLLNDNCKRICDQLAASTLTMQAYFYVYPEVDSYRQADWFISIIQNSGYPIKFLWADVENYDAPMLPDARSLSYQRFVERVALHFPTMTGVYTGKWFVDGFAPKMNDWLPKYLAWISHWGNQPKTSTMMEWRELTALWLPNYDIKVPTGSLGKVVGHQFTGDKCYLPGAYCKYDAVPWWPYKGRDRLDVSVFDKTFLTQIKNNVNPTPPPAPPPLPVPPNTYFVNNWMVNIRSTPDASSDANKLTPMVQNTRIVVDLFSADGLWAHFLPQAGYPNGAWVWKIYITKVV